MKDLVSTAEAAKRLNVTTTRIRQMIIEGVIVGADKLGRDYFIPEREIVRLEKTERKAGRPAKAKK
jgi:excisionase family DNA binding protein